MGFGVWSDGFGSMVKDSEFRVYGLDVSRIGVARVYTRHGRGAIDMR